MGIFILTLCFQDFYLDLVEDNRRITPRDYLELALSPVQGGKRDVAAKNEVIYLAIIYSYTEVLWLIYVS